MRMTGDTAPNWTQRMSSSGVSSRVPSAKNPPMSDPQVLTPDMPIDSAAARAAIDRHIGIPLGLATHEAAWGIHSVANAAMIRAIQTVSSEIGRSPADFAMVAFGGNGAVHGATLAAAAGIYSIVIPPASGVFSALGLLFARIQHRLVKVFWHDLDKVDLQALNARAAELQREAAEMMAGEGVQVAGSELHLSLDLRYAGQSSEIAIPVNLAEVTQSTLAEAAERFHQEHERSYGYCSRGERVQIVNLRLRARSLERQDHLPTPSALRAKPAGASAKERRVYFGPDTGWITAPVIRRGDLGEKPQVGPVIIEEYDTTIIVPPAAQVLAVSDIVRIQLYAKE